LTADTWLSGTKISGSFVWQPSASAVDTTWCKGGCGGPNGDDSIEFANGGCSGILNNNGCLDNKPDNEDHQYLCEIAV
jgi:hypothetical protein